VLICQGQGAKPSSLGPVPAGFDAWYERGTALDREQRFQSASELADALSALLGHVPDARASSAAVPALALASTEKVSAVSSPRTVSAVVQPASEHASRPPTWRAPAIGVLAALALAGTLWALVRTPEETSKAEPMAAPEALTSSEPGSSVAPPAATPPVVPAAAPIDQAPAPAPPPTVSAIQPDANAAGGRSGISQPAQPAARRATDMQRQRERPPRAKARERAAKETQKAFDPYENL
jgi:serine/threonine-protein kinase